MSTPFDPLKSSPSSPGASPSPDAAPAQVSPRDLLITRMVDGVAQESDWNDLGRIARTDASIFTDLAHAHRIDRAVRAFAAPLVAQADRVSLPPTAADLDTTFPIEPVHVPHRSRARRAPFLGWAIAACLALALGAEIAGVRLGLSGRNTTPSNAAGLVAPTFASADQAMNAYVELGKQQGKVVGEMPQKFVIQSQPAPDGEGLEVVYIRQFIERAIVKDLYTLGTDELGRTILVPAAAPKDITPTSPL